MTFKKKKKTFETVLFIQALPIPKVALLNLGVHQFSYSELLIHLKRHLKRSLCMTFKRK